ncbi:MAG: WD40 repeat domain-containing protein, partial [bacterium]|nr:WD40 repeat domain-containing protein [bacterium]
MIPKLPKTANDPELLNSNVYPSWGPVCQRYTYSVIYRDKKGRKPEYVKIYFNGKMIETQPSFAEAPAGKKDYQRGVKYEYKYVPNKLGSNFYYFEASNGLGKTRAGIIDSPDNGPVLFRSAFDKNEIAVIDKQSNKKILRFSTGKEWVGGISLSDDGRYLAAKTFKHVYLFDINKPEKPLWQFNCEECGESKGGVDISGDGSKIIAALGEVVVAFNRTSNKPIWKHNTRNAYNVAISRDGKYMAAATMGEESNPDSNLLILWSDKSGTPLWQYHASGNFHDVSLSADGSFVAGSTGCPDRRFYLFSKDSNKPLIRTDPLTRDSPVHQAKISADGSSAAAGSESDAGAVFLFNKNSKTPVWKFESPGGSSVRALNFTPDGRYIGAATFGGQAYIFDKDKNTPIATWIVNNASLGGIDIADDGSFIAVGGTDNKLHLFDRDKKVGAEISFDEYLEEIDISANGKYIAAGTGGSVYFFETFDKDTTPVVCTAVAEPKAEEEKRGGGDCGPGQKCDAGDRTQKAKTGIFERFFGFLKRLFGSKTPSSKPTTGEAVCGNDLCEPNLGETRE